MALPVKGLYNSWFFARHFTPTRSIAHTQAFRREVDLAPGNPELNRSSLSYYTLDTFGYTYFRSLLCCLCRLAGKDNVRLGRQKNDIILWYPFMLTVRSAGGPTPKMKFTFLSMWVTGGVLNFAQFAGENDFLSIHADANVWPTLHICIHSASFTSQMPKSRSLCIQFDPQPWPLASTYKVAPPLAVQANPQGAIHGCLVGVKNHKRCQSQAAAHDNPWRCAVVKPLRHVQP